MRSTRVSIENFDSYDRFLLWTALKSGTRYARVKNGRQGYWVVDPAINLADFADGIGPDHSTRRDRRANRNIASASRGTRTVASIYRECVAATRFPASSYGMNAGMKARSSFPAEADLQAHRILALSPSDREHAYERLKELSRKDATGRGIGADLAADIANTVVQRQQRLVQILEWTTTG